MKAIKNWDDKPRLMWVWDGDSDSESKYASEKKKRKVVAILETDKHAVIALSADEKRTERYCHCAEIEPLCGGKMTFARKILLRDAKERWHKERYSYKLDDGTRICQTVEVNVKRPKIRRNRKPICFYGWGAKEFLEKYALKANLRITRIDCDLGRVRMDCFGSKNPPTEA